MSSQLKEEKINENDHGNIYSQERHPDGFSQNSKVNLNDLVNRLKSEKKKERKNNLLLSVAAVSAVTAFGIILTL